MTVKRVDNKLVPLISSALTLSGSWQDVGEMINLMDVRSLALWLKLDINDSLDFRVRFLGSNTEAGTDLYEVPILEVTPTKVNVAPEFFEFSNDLDQNVILSIPSVDQILFGKFQVQVGTVGATAGQLTAAGVTFTSNEVGAGGL